jgi:hypothetical protein
MKRHSDNSKSKKNRKGLFRQRLRSMKVLFLFAILLLFGTVQWASAIPVASVTSTMETPPVGTVTARQDEPRTVREFFMAFTQDVFYIEGCDESSDPGCRKARTRYLDTYLEIEDTKNGYLTAGGDGAQAALKMTIFRKPSGKYIVAVNQFGEIGDDYNFWEYVNGRWKDVSKAVIPEYGPRKMYELPRYGTKIEVFAKKIIDTDGVVEMSEKGAKLYDLVWKDGKFSILKN